MVNIASFFRSEISRIARKDIRADGFVTLRKMLGLSATDMGKLLDVTQQTISEVRKLGKRGAAARLAEA